MNTHTHQTRSLGNQGRIAAGLLALTLFSLLSWGCAAPTAVEEKKVYSFWPPPPDEPRIQFLTSMSKSKDIAAPKSAMDNLIYGKEVEEVLPISKPYGVAMWNGIIYVCDMRDGAVVGLNMLTHQTLVIGRTGSETLQRPVAIAITPDGMKYVADVDRASIFVFDDKDRFVQFFNRKDKKFKPVGLAVYKDELFVCNYASQTIDVLDRHTGKTLRVIGESHEGNDQSDQFARPLGITVDKEGAIYVTDMLLCKVKKFNYQGKFVHEFGSSANNIGNFVRPKHLTVDKDGTIFVVDAAFANVQAFNQKGEIYTFFGGAGDHPGAMDLPAGISVDESPSDLALFKDYVHPAFEAHELILVTSQFGENKVSVYALGKLKAGHTVAEIKSAAPLTLQPAGAAPAIPAPTSPPPMSAPPKPKPATQPAPSLE